MPLRRFAIFCLNRLWQPWFPKVFLRIVDDEFCYRRIPPRSVLNGKIIPAQGFTFPRPSCFRSRWSNPEDALLPDACNGRVLQGYGVARIRARDLRRELKLIEPKSRVGGVGDGSAHTISIVMDVLPDPLRRCFAHSEIRNEAIVPSHVGVPGEDLDEEDRARLRAVLAYRAEVIITPYK